MSHTPPDRHELHADGLTRRSVEHGDLRILLKPGYGGHDLWLSVAREQGREFRLYCGLTCEAARHLAFVLESHADKADARRARELRRSGALA